MRAFAGVVGTAVMSLLILMAPIMGISMPGPWEMLAGFLNTPASVGWALHFSIGITLALSYAAFFAHRLPCRPWQRGTLYGVAPWLMAQVVVIPMMGMPLFSGSILMAAGSLVGHLVYGASVGATYGHAYEEAAVARRHARRRAGSGARRSPVTAQGTAVNRGGALPAYVGSLRFV